MTKDLHPIEAAIVAVMALAWAIGTIVRLLLVPAVAVVLVLAGWRPASPEARPEPAAAPEAPTLAGLAAELQVLPAVQLRQITGCRRRIAKRVMVEAWLAMPV